MSGHVCAPCMPDSPMIAICIPVYGVYSLHGSVGFSVPVDAGRRRGWRHATATHGCGIPVPGTPAAAILVEWWSPRRESWEGRTGRASSRRQSRDPGRGRGGPRTLLCVHCLQMWKEPGPPRNCHPHCRHPYIPYTRIHAWSWANAASMGVYMAYGPMWPGGDAASPRNAEGRDMWRRGRPTQGADANAGRLDAAAGQNPCSSNGVTSSRCG